MTAMASRYVLASAVQAILAAVTAVVMSGFPRPALAAQPERTVFHNMVISRGDPAVNIRLPGSAHYVGADRFLLTDPKLGAFDDCELHAFVDPEDDHYVRKLYWVQFEAYLPSQPALHHTYDSPRHLTLGDVDFYLDTWVSSGSTPEEPGSDAAHLDSLLAAHGYRRDDSMSVRLVHLTDATKRKELMIIYAESLAPTGYTAAELKEGGADHARWAAIEGELIRRARQSISITRGAGPGRRCGPACRNLRVQCRAFDVRVMPPSLHRAASLPSRIAHLRWMRERSAGSGRLSS